jgi:hypothetical protein
MKKQFFHSFEFEAMFFQHEIFLISSGCSVFPEEMKWIVEDYRFEQNSSLWRLKLEEESLKDVRRNVRRNCLVTHKDFTSLSERFYSSIHSYC